MSNEGLWARIAMDKRFPLWWLAALVAIVALVVGYFGWSGSLELKTDVLSADSYGQLFANLFIVAVIVERFIETFNSIYRRKGRLEKIRALDNAKGENEKETAQLELDAYRTRTETLAMYTGFFVGILVGFAGLRTLAIVFTAEGLVGGQVTLFWTMDILLTAGLIAGGSKGINGVTGIISDFMDQSKRQAGSTPQAQGAPNQAASPPAGSPQAPAQDAPDSQN